MTDWQRVREDRFAVPADRSVADLVAELCVMVRSPDPVVRDEQAYAILANWIGAGVLDPDLLMTVGAEMAARFDDPEIQARTFAPLILDSIATAGVVAPSWVAAFTRWYPSEPDLRGYDQQLGWLHAVAHGADLLATLGRSPQVEPTAMLDLAAKRLLAPTEFVWRDQEDDRLALAVALTLTGPDVTEAQATDWLEPIAASFRNGEPGPVPAFASNMMRTLRMLYILVDRGVKPGRRDQAPIAVGHRKAILDRLADVLAIVTPYAL
jgi:hypothetical protein